MEKIVDIRKELHQIAEISGQEANTSKKVTELLKQTNPEKVLTEIGGHGVAAIYKGKNPAITIVLRAELDALPIKEINDFEYVSLTPGVSHKCGHDGHMAILLGLAKEMNKIIADKPCNVILLFQPAEETAEGAYEVLKSSAFNEIKPDYIFALHNLPGFPLKSIIVKNESFASASIGMIAELKGMTSHAGHPENGRNPVLAMTNIIQGLLSLPALHTKLENAANITIIHAKMGEIAFGTSPGDAVVMATLRAHHNDDMEILINKARGLVKGIAETYGLEYNISWQDKFPATVNNLDCVEIVKKSSGSMNCNLIEMQYAFPWSEDFGWYTQKYKGAFFGIGSGTNHPQLHNADYDFPDEIIDTGIGMFKNIIVETVNYIVR